MAYTQAQLVAAFTAANNGVAPDAATTSLLGAFAAQNQAGQLTDAAVLAYVINSAQDDVQVAVQAYQFFTGKTPTKAGLDFLTNSAANTTDLNDPYYAQFNLENRYINFAANLGINGEGAAAFTAAYGSMNFQTFVGVVYETIIGSSYATAAKINVAAAVADIISRQAAFTQTARDRGIITTASTAAQVDLATKAAVVGYLMAEGVKADVGIYAAGANNFVNALISGTAVHNVNLLTTYSALGGGVGSAVPGGGGSTGTGQLTVNPETLTANVFNAPQAYTPGGNDLVNTLQNDDFLTGVGTDPTLNVTLGNPNDNGNALITPSFRGVEVVNARFDSTTANMTLDLQDTQGTAINGGVDTINITRIAAGFNATVQNIAESVATTLSVSNSQAVGSNVAFTYLANALTKGDTTFAGKGDVGTMTLSNVNINMLRVEENNAAPTEGFEALTVSSVGSANKVGFLQAEDLQLLNIAGDKNLTLGADSVTVGIAGLTGLTLTNEATRWANGLANVAGSLHKIDATGFKGNLELTLGTEFNAGRDDTSGTNVALSVIGGDGNDTFRLNGSVINGSNPGSTAITDLINGGAGTNTLVVQGNTTINAAGTIAVPVANVTNIQALQIRNGQDLLLGAETTTINADAFDKLATIFIRDEGQALAAGVWTSGSEVTQTVLNNLTSAQINGITIAHGTTANSTIANNLVVANLKVATGTADTATVTIVDGINSDPVFNFNLTTTAVERVTFVDSDTESNSVLLTQGGFAATASATAPALAGSSITLTGGATGQYFNLDTVAAAAVSGANSGYGYATDGSQGSSTGTLLNSGFAPAGPINAAQPANVATTVSLGTRDQLVANAIGDATSNYRSVLYGAGQNGTAAPTLRWAGEGIVAGAYLGDVVVRLGDVTRADGVSSQSITTGVGNDTFIFDALNIINAGFTSGDTITAGTGFDTLVVDGDTALIPGTPRVDHQTSEWDNLKGIDAFRFANNAAVANVGSGNRVANTGGGYYAAIDNDFISQTDAGNRLVIINNDGNIAVNTESDVVVDLRGLSQTKFVTFIGANGVGGGVNGQGIANHASSRIVVDDISANGSMILNGGDNELTTTTTIASFNNNVYEVRNTANVSINDLAQTSNFGLIEFTNDQAVVQTLTLTLNNNVLSALVDSSRVGIVNGGGAEVLNITATDNGAVASVLNVDARQVSGFNALNVLGSVAGNDIFQLNTNVGGTANVINGRGGTADRINWFTNPDSTIITYGAAGANTAAFSTGASTTTHTITNVEINDVTQLTEAAAVPNAQYRFNEGAGNLSAGGVFPAGNQIIGALAANDQVRVNGALGSIQINNTAQAVAAGTAFTALATNGIDLNTVAHAGSFITATANDLSNFANVVAAIGTVNNETAGEEIYITLNNTAGTAVGVYHFVAVTANNTVDATELELVGIVNTTTAWAVGNFLFY